VFLGRVKVHLPGLWDGDPLASPWVYPHNNAMLGGRPDSSSFAVPEMASELTVEFPTDDIYHPFYTGYWQSAITHQVGAGYKMGSIDGDEATDRNPALQLIPPGLMFNRNYPETFGMRTKNNDYMMLDKEDQIGVIHMSDGSYIINNAKEQFLEVVHSSGSKVQFNKNGDVHWDVVRDLHVNVGRDIITKGGRDYKTKVGGEYHHKTAKVHKTTAGGDHHIKAANLYSDGAFQSHQAGVASEADEAEPKYTKED
jgi:hypothetical protein